MGWEVYFFSSDSLYNKGFDFYKSLMLRSFSSQITMEMSSSYFPCSSKVPKRIYDFNKHMKLILVVDDPVRRLHSDYLHQKNTVHAELENTHKFEDLIFLPGSYKVNISYPPVTTSMYYNHVKRWLRYFPLDQFLFVDGVGFRANPLRILKEVEKFLGIYSYFNESQFYYNDARGFYCLSSKGCEGKDKGLFHPELAEETKDALYGFYNEPNKKLMELTGVDFEWLHPKSGMAYDDVYPDAELQGGVFLVYHDLGQYLLCDPV